MLENLPDAVGHALHNTRAGLEKTAFSRVELAAGTSAIEVSSLAFASYGAMPARYTADGEGVSPPLSWTGVPAAASSVLLIVEDADSPTPQPLVHAIVVDLEPGDGALPEGALKSHDHDGSGLKTGRNSYLQSSWLPPDPPPGHGVHRYVFQVFALSDGPAFDGTPGRDAVIDAIRERALASGQMVGIYERPDSTLAVPDADPMTAGIPPAMPM